MVMYEEDDDSDSEDDDIENPFDRNENPTKILCFLLWMIVKKSMLWYNLVTLVIINKIPFFFNDGIKNMSGEVIFSDQCCILFQWTLSDVPYW